MIEVNLKKCTTELATPPVLFLIFNRPDQTKQVFEQIRKHRPTHLFIAADGPRPGHHTDDQNCQDSRAIIDSIDWDCEVKTRFQEFNIGSKYAVSQAITWFFSFVDRGIIIEDDCLPNDSFFKFTAEMLEVYQKDEQIMMISGCSFQPSPLNTDSYYFSKYAHVWGWATWRRAWKMYHVELDDVPETAFTSVLKSTFPLKRERNRWRYNFNLILTGLDAWDYQWMFWIWKNQGLTIIPWQNMISNIGFGAEATHTFDVNSRQSRMRQYEMTTIHHPSIVIQNQKADAVERYIAIIDPIAKAHWHSTRSIAKTLIKSVLYWRNHE